MKFEQTDFIRRFNEGEVFAYPTEAVYGLGCDPRNQSAMDKILELKRRPVEKGVILIAGELSQIKDFVDMSQIPEKHMAFITSAWPGPNTFLVPHSGKTPEWISGGSDLVAVRVTTHPLVKAMCSAVNSPLVSTSANLGGEPPARTDEDVRAYFGQRVCLLDGELGSQKNPSSIYNALTMEKLR